MTYARPGTEGSIVEFAPRYDNFIGGEWVAPVEGRYFENSSPIDGKVFTEVARSSAADIELALDAADGLYLVPNFHFHAAHPHRNAM